MEPIPPVSGELAELWKFLERYDFYEDEMEDWYRDWARRDLPDFIENVELLRDFLASNPDVYVLHYTVAVVMQQDCTGTDGKAERAVLHSLLERCNQIIDEVERQENES
ncbi:hypothetical protein ACFP81_13260 [Deinococcus lacus]|uniref:Uncharacterized protein n=1 Tax=Deinococcus lacus TaxID=392561 RepID=A0ABW1YHE2_9DEIO